MGAKLYSASHCTKIKEIIHKIRNNFLISEQISFSHVVISKNKEQVTNIKVCASQNACCFIKGILIYKFKMYL